MCAECLARERGRNWTEARHIAGRRNLDHIVVVPLNTHRVLSARQEGWVVHALRNPHQSPLLRAAAALCGVLDVVAELVHKSVGWIPELLERIDESLCATYGSDRWAGIAVGWRTRGTAPPDPAVGLLPAGARSVPACDRNQLV